MNQKDEYKKDFVVDVVYSVVRVFYFAKGKFEAWSILFHR